jgi:hypothetical protein
LSHPSRLYLQIVQRTCGSHLTTYVPCLRPEHAKAGFSVVLSQF